MAAEAAESAPRKGVSDCSASAEEQTVLGQRRHLDDCYVYEDEIETGGDMVFGSTKRSAVL